MRRAFLFMTVLCSVLTACALDERAFDRADDLRVDGPWWDYKVVVREGGRELEVFARFESGEGGLFEIDRASVPAVRELSMSSGEDLELTEDGWRIPESSQVAGGVARLRWIVDLDQVSRTRAVQIASDGEDTAYIASAGSFLLRPTTEWQGALVRVRFELEPGVALASGLMRGRDAKGFVFPAARIDHLPATVMGDFFHSRVSVGNSTIDVAVIPGEKAVTNEELARFVEAHAGAVAEFYGDFPVDHALVLIVPNRRGGYGRANGSGGASVMYLLDRRNDLTQVMSDWVLVHEMIHFACPLLAREHHWFEEGLSTYLEPIVRRTAGWQTGREVWENFFAKLHNGLPAVGDRGLDRTRTWGRTYWGGALFCLLADIEIRQQTNNEKSLRDALRAVVENGGSILRPATMRDTLEVGDAGLGVDVLVPLWEAMRHDPYPVDLDHLWNELGIARVNGRLEFDDTAPLAEIREAIAKTESTALTSSN